MDRIVSCHNVESRKISAMNKLNALAKQRTASRLTQANGCLHRIVADAKSVGLQVSVVGLVGSRPKRPELLMTEVLINLHELRI